MPALLSRRLSAFQIFRFILHDNSLTPRHSTDYLDDWNYKRRPLLVACQRRAALDLAKGMGDLSLHDHQAKEKVYRIKYVLNVDWRVIRDHVCFVGKQSSNWHPACFALSRIAACLRESHAGKAENECQCDCEAVFHLYISFQFYRPCVRKIRSGLPKLEELRPDI